MGVYFCGGFVFIAVDVSLIGDYEKLIILAIIAGVRSQELYQFRLHWNDIALVFGHQSKQVIPLIKEDCFSRTWQR